MYKVIEVAKMLGVSKVTIYKKIQNNSNLLKPYIHMRNNTTHITTEGIEILAELLDTKPSFPEQNMLEREYKIFLESQKDFLEMEIAKKKKLLKNKQQLILEYKKRKINRKK